MFLGQEFLQDQAGVQERWGGGGRGRVATGLEEEDDENPKEVAA